MEEEEEEKREGEGRERENGKEREGGEEREGEGRWRRGRQKWGRRQRGEEAGGGRSRRDKMGALPQPAPGTLRLRDGAPRPAGRRAFNQSSADVCYTVYLFHRDRTF